MNINVYLPKISYDISGYKRIYHIHNEKTVQIVPIIFLLKSSL